MSQHIPRVDVLGVHISATTVEIATQQILEWIAEGAHQYVCATGVHGVMECQRSVAIRDIHNQSGMTTPDGMPMVWCSRFAGIRETQRVYGPDLMLAVMQRGIARRFRHYLFGATPQTLELLERRLLEQFPGVRIVGAHSPPFGELSEGELLSHAATINAVGADVVWVGVGTPKQERWMATMLPAMNANVLIGVGAAFDFHAGVKRQAPHWMQRTGLEWLFRLATEPSRLARRYLRNNPEFLARIAANRPRVVSSS